MTMSDMADYTNDMLWKGIEHHNRYRDAPLEKQYEEGLVDVNGKPIYPDADDCPRGEW